MIMALLLSSVWVVFMQVLLDTMLVDVSHAIDKPAAMVVEVGNVIDVCRLTNGVQLDNDKLLI